MAAQPPFTENLIYTSPLYNSATAADARKRLRDARRQQHHQHLRHQPQLPVALRAKLDLRGRANAAAQRADGIRVHRDQGHGTGRHRSAHAAAVRRSRPPMHSSNTTPMARIRLTMPDRFAPRGDFSTGMSAVLLYTYSKAIDNATSYTGASGSRCSTPITGIWSAAYRPSISATRFR